MHTAEVGRKPERESLAIYILFGTHTQIHRHWRERVRVCVCSHERTRHGNGRGCSALVVGKQSEAARSTLGGKTLLQT